MPGAAKEGLPILGMFRDTLDDLGRDLASLIHAVFCGPGFRLPIGTHLQRAANGGAVGDCAFLASSPQEYSSGNMPRLPHLLRRELKARNPAIQLFNPRGEELCEIPLVASFGGLLLECLDPNAVAQGLARGIPNDAIGMFTRWRAVARQYLDSGAPQELKHYVDHWGRRDPGNAVLTWPKSVGAIDLVYALIHFFPELHDDPEGQVYLEVFTKQLTACAQIGKFDGRVVHRPDKPPDRQGVTVSQRSVIELLRDWLGPIANGSVKVTEELIATFPRDRLSVLSIHQAKGLEFPLAIVDVGSDLKRNHSAHAFKRFPSSGGDPHVLENAMRPFSELGVPQRSQIDRAFDDLYRQYFVAFSRPKDVLLLVGLTSALPANGIPNIATGYRRDETSAWEPNWPFTLI
jgi:DNA helicase-2/ATP-dependent DNA helicase PcrA